MTTPARLRSRRADHRPVPVPVAVPVAPVAPPVLGRRAGFVLYVSLPDDGPDDVGSRPRPTTTQIAETADLLRELAQEALPGSETFAAISLAPGSTGDASSIGDRLTHLRLLAPVDDAAPGTPDVLSGSGDAR